MKFLVIRFSSIGDILLCTPVFRLLKQKFPQSEIHFVTKSPFANLLKGNENINQVFAWENTSDMSELYGNQYELFNFINNYRKEFYSLSPEQIAFPRSCQGINEYADPVKIYKLSTPMHTRGALMHNHYVNKMKLTKKIELIRESDKIKFIHLKTPNPLQSTNVIAFLDKLPSEFKVDQYIDYDTMFQKVFLDALKLIITPLGWKTEETSSLEDFF